MLESFFLKKSRSHSLQLCQNRLQHRRFPVNIAKFLKTATFIEEHLQLLLFGLKEYEY